MSLNRLDSTSRRLLASKIERYAAAYRDSPADEYMTRRGIPADAAATFRLGFVTDEAADGGDEQYVGMLCIPYLTPTGPVTVKYRNLRPDASPKYLAPINAPTHLYNVLDLHKKSDRMVITEGEVDAMTLSMVGIPSVGIPGVNNFKPFHRRVFDGYSDIVIATDNDAREDGNNPGQELARLLLREIYGSRLVTLPRGYDINSFFVERGEEELCGLFADERE